MNSAWFGPSRVSLFNSVFRSIALTAAAAGLVHGVRRVAGRFGTAAVLEIRHGAIYVVKGQFSSSALTGAKGIIAAARVRNGSIRIRKKGRVVFSRSIPPSSHQRIINVLRSS